ncbi:hypothetical protein WN48_09131 [Eufriesea mexicana]|nr:PREDICTED: uncharacterized protein LOC108546168 isoform X2 [Eufriesea mexicana]OAD59391.1 hypothetical protein WN48_09131 [Eufriesea mexicana]
MSGKETLKSDTEPDSCLSETPKSEGKDNAKSTSRSEIESLVSSVDDQNSAKQEIKCTVSRWTEDEIMEVPTKEVNTALIANAKIFAEIPSEPVEKEVEENVKCELNRNESLPSVLEMQQQTSIGAGDTCFCAPRDGSADGQKPEDQIALSFTTDQLEPESNKSVVEKDKDTNVTDLAVRKLKEEIQKTSDERDSYRKKLENVESKLAELQASYDALLKGDGNEVVLRRMVDQLKGKLIQTSLQLEDRMRIVSNQEKQICALNSQVASLKEVESLTRSLLQIRNMEVKHLQAEVDDMEVRISEERERYSTMINKMDAAVKLNADLKKEYETQLCLFRDLREKYEEKVSLLSKEKLALEANAQTAPK